MGRLFQGRKKKTRHVPTSAFWIALLRVHNYQIHAFERELNCWLALPPEKRRDHIFGSMQVVNSWLNIAIHDGWLEENER